MPRAFCSACLTLRAHFCLACSTPGAAHTRPQLADLRKLAHAAEQTPAHCTASPPTVCVGQPQQVDAAEAPRSARPTSPSVAWVPRAMHRLVVAPVAQWWHPVARPSPPPSSQDTGTPAASDTSSASLPEQSSSHHLRNRRRDGADESAWGGAAAAVPFAHHGGLGASASTSEASVEPAAPFQFI